jgi:uncharacterized membrane protein YfhO
MELATGVDAEGYSVSIPPFKTGRPDLDNIRAQPDAVLLGIINVKYLISAFEISGDGFDLIREYPEGFLYKNESYLPRAWMIPHDIYNGAPLDFSDIKQVEKMEKATNKIKLLASGPGTLVLSEVAYPGWRAKINGEPVTISTVYNLIQAVRLPPGNNQIEFIFRPRSVYAGLILGSLGWGYCLYKLIKQDDKKIPL